MKYLLIIVGVVVAALLGFYGFRAYQRSAVVQSERAALLISSKRGMYAYSTSFLNTDVPNDFSVAGYLDTLTGQQVKDMTAGLMAYVYASPAPTIVSGTSGSTEVSEPIILTNQQQQNWAKALNLLSQPVRDMCGAISIPSQVQYCLARHIMWVAVRGQGGLAICANLYIDSQKAECDQLVTAKDATTFTDKNTNQQLDVFEAMALPEDQRSNTYNLPVLNAID